MGATHQSGFVVVLCLRAYFDGLHPSYAPARVFALPGNAIQPFTTHSSAVRCLARTEVRVPKHIEIAKIGSLVSMLTVLFRLQSFRFRYFQIAEYSNSVHPYRVTCRGYLILLVLTRPLPGPLPHRIKRDFCLTGVIPGRIFFNQFARCRNRPNWPDDTLKPA